MASNVLISDDLIEIPYIDRLAVGIALFHDTGKYPDFLGHFGQFENNPSAMESQLHKIHIALYDEDWNLKKWRNRNGYNRTSDNFVIYAKHFFCENYFLILDIVTPEAHRRIDSLMPTLIIKAEQFHQLRPQDLAHFPSYTAENVEIAKTLVLTN